MALGWKCMCLVCLVMVACTNKTGDGTDDGLITILRQDYINDTSVNASKSYLLSNYGDTAIIYYDLATLLKQLELPYEIPEKKYLTGKDTVESVNDTTLHPLMRIYFTYYYKDGRLSWYTAHMENFFNDTARFYYNNKGDFIRLTTSLDSSSLVVFYDDRYEKNNIHHLVHKRKNAYTLYTISNYKR